MFVGTARCGCYFTLTSKRPHIAGIAGRIHRNTHYAFFFSRCCDIYTADLCNSIMPKTAWAADGLLFLIHAASCRRKDTGRGGSSTRGRSVGVEGLAGIAGCIVSRVVPHLIAWVPLGLLLGRPSAVLSLVCHLAMSLVSSIPLSNCAGSFHLPGRQQSAQSCRIRTHV